MNGRSIKAGPNHLRMAEAAALLMKEPRTISELADAMEASNKDLVYRYIDAFRGEGLVYVKEWRKHSRGALGAVYAWQSSVCALEDAPRPRCRTDQ